MNTTKTSDAQCKCANCPGAGCQCGCNTPYAAMPAACRCGPACRCESAASGCLCR